MKKTFLQSLLILLLATKEATANPACVVCTVAIGASLSVARELGIDDNIVGLWLGALLTLLGYWTIFWFNKKHWNFWGRDIFLLLLSFSLVGAIYIKDLVYTPRVIGWILYMDTFLFSAILGAFIFIFAEKLYDYLKQKNGGHAHFPFEKVVLPMALLGIASLYFTYFPLYY